MENAQRTVRTFCRLDAMEKEIGRPLTAQERQMYEDRRWEDNLAMRAMLLSLYGPILDSHTFLGDQRVGVSAIMSTDTI